MSTTWSSGHVSVKRLRKIDGGRCRRRGRDPKRGMLSQIRAGLDAG
jgi:hypothetical protein